MNSLKDAFKQIFRNFSMCLASFFSVTAILLILGVFFIIIVNINVIAESAKDDFGTVQIFLKDSVSVEKADELAINIKNNNDIENVTYKTKAEALNELKKKWGKSGSLLDSLTTNPLPNTLVVKVKNLENAESIVNTYKTHEDVEEVSYYKDTVDKIISVSNFIKIVGLVIITILIIISVFVVMNTIKLTVHSREREIKIMKNVGATNWYIRGPFIFEGIIIGIFSALVSSLVIGGIYHMIVSKTNLELIMIMQTGFADEMSVIPNLVIIFTCLGVSIGAFGSLISIRKFLET